MIEKEYIDLEEAVATLKHNSLKCFNSYYKGYVNAIEDFADIPPADVAPVRHGHWIDQCEEDVYSCSVCGAEWMTIEGAPKENGMDFCPHCGAKLDEEEDEGESITNDDLLNLALKKLNMTIRELKSEYRREHNL